MSVHNENRKKIVSKLRRELFGPAPAGREIVVEGELRFDDPKEAYGPWRQRGSGEEILMRDAPTKRYGVGVLFPVGAPLEEGSLQSDSSGDEGEPTLPDDVSAPLDLEVKPTEEEAETEKDDLDLSMANAYQPSSLGVSFLTECPKGATLVVEVRGGRYERKQVTILVGQGEPRKRTWWLRRPVNLRAEFPSGSLIQPGSARLTELAANLPNDQSSNTEGLDIQIEVFSRPQGAGTRLVTVCLVNRTLAPASGNASEFCLFQTSFRATMASPSNLPCILPYPAPRAAEDEAEEESLALLYRRTQTFATGHGCATNWGADDGERGRVRWVSAECLPVVDTPDITPEILREDKSPVVVAMAPLAGLVDGNDGKASVEEVISLYEGWIDERKKSIDGIPERYRSAANRHMEQCDRAVKRMKDGLDYIREDANAALAFQLANHAILLQQLVARNEPRRFDYAAKEGKIAFAESYRAPDFGDISESRGNWRPFQIAFLLASLRSSVEPSARDRRTVELIWFPTGGGKTEAYLGLAAFAMFKRRLDDPSDAGVHVLMRYTLRLLTAQQFQRASALICAMEYLRRQYQGELGATEFSAGIWLGGETTPNTREQALEALRKIEKSPSAVPPFSITRCPWCGAQFGRCTTGRKTPALTPGYVRRRKRHWPNETVAFACPDTACDFSSGLPIHVIDEDIYAVRPTLVIGTIDKFAMLAWRPAARAIFGLDPMGIRELSPPGLIIQDELHLISGPLGSLAGLYETMIEELCTDNRPEEPVPPKIVSSTATTRRYAEQIKSLYAREDVALFPPPGLEAGDSFFARYDDQRPGRKYVGVHAVSLGSVQTEWVRTFTALLQSPTQFIPDERDPWWTMVVFFNSIREMGTAHTLFQSDVPDYAKVIWNREGTESEQRRYLSAARIFELTGGLPSNEITEAIAKLEVDCTSAKSTPMDVCLASNIIEVGIDIPRLSLMVVAGQPKTTSQYIQVTGRVGRLRDRPGLIVTMYSPSKPRDRSHFERFRSYHEGLYAHVEPTSVTPFSPPALNRALHAVLAAYARQTGNQSVSESPYPYPRDLVERFRAVISRRSQVVDREEAANVERVFDRRAREWREWNRTEWSRRGQSEEIPQLRIPGEHASLEEERLSWATPTSMRNVDAECRAIITTLYLTEREDEDA